MTQRTPPVRLAVRMSVDRGREAEYSARHSPIWPELEEELRAAGVLTYSIFLDRETNHLFGYIEVEDMERWDRVADSPVCRRWWASMRELMPSNPDDSPMTTRLEEVFHLE